MAAAAVATFASGGGGGGGHPACGGPTALPHVAAEAYAAEAARAFHEGLRGLVAAAAASVNAAGVLEKKASAFAAALSKESATLNEARLRLEAERAAFEEQRRGVGVTGVAMSCASGGGAGGGFRERLKLDMVATAVASEPRSSANPDADAALGDNPSASAWAARRRAFEEELRALGLQGSEEKESAPLLSWRSGGASGGCEDGRTVRFPETAGSPLTDFIFDAIDTNQDNIITRQELRQAVRSGLIHECKAIARETGTGGGRGGGEGGGVATSALELPSQLGALERHFQGMLDHGDAERMKREAALEYAITIGNWSYTVLPPRSADDMHPSHDMSGRTVVVPEGWEVLSSDSEGFDGVIRSLALRGWGTLRLCVGDGLGLASYGTVLRPFNLAPGSKLTDDTCVLQPDPSDTRKFKFTDKLVSGRLVICSYVGHRWHGGADCMGLLR